MALLLVTVGILQYQWATQLSAATEVRLGSNLQSLMTSWHRDFYDELAAICIALQVGPDSGAHDAWNDYLQRYAQWNQSEANGELAEGIEAKPDLVREIYEWQTSARGTPELLRLNPNAKVLESVNIPKELATLLGRLRENSSNLRIAMRAWEFRGSPESETLANKNPTPAPALRSNALAGWQFDENIPALVHPVVHHADPYNSQTPVDRVAVDWLVVVLDLKVIQNRILPELANRHFRGPDGLDYKLAVVATGPAERVIYSSDPTLRINDVGSFDSVMYLFGSSSDGVQTASGQPAKHARNSQDQDWRSFSAPVWFPLIQYASRSDPWALILRHRTGPVGKVARSVWYWDLTIGGIVLLLLAANMGLVFFSSLRAQKLAKLQLDFVAAVSHEFLSPLSAMYCTGQNAKDGLVQTKAEVKAHGSIITSQARQLIDLVKQNLLFAATERGTKRYTLHPLQVSEIVRNVRKDLALLIEENAANIDCQIQEGLPNVMGDLSALTQCLQNLVVNAVKYSGRNCWIGISASLHDTKNDTREIQISVQDHGPGMSGSELRHIFEPFYRSPRVVEAQIHGTGLGLTVADRMAKAMGGSLSATSEVGVGSTFVLHLPVQSAGVEVSADLKEAIWGQK
jgi:signal transduction histidine kinase